MEDESKNYKDYGRIVLIVVCIAVVIAGAWYVLERPTADRTASEHVESGFDDTDREQQEAKRNIDAIETGVTDSQRSLDAIADSVERSQGTTAAIANADASVAAGIEKSERSAERITSGIDRVAAADNAAIGGIERAEAANASAQSQMGRATELRSQGERLNNESERILTKYSDGIPAKRESP